MSTKKKKKETYYEKAERLHLQRLKEMSYDPRTTEYLGQFANR